MSTMASYPNLTKYKNILKVQTAKKSTQKHKTIRTTKKVSPWNDQCIFIVWGTGGGLNPVLQVPNLDVRLCCGSQHSVEVVRSSW